MESEPIALRIEWLGKGSRTIPLPIPFLSRSDQAGSVTCNPIGEFPVEDGMRLLEIAGEEGLFKLVEKVYPKGAELVKSEVPRETIAPQEEVATEYYAYTCHCGCGGKLAKKPTHRYTGMPKYLLGHAGFKKKQKKVEAQSPTI